MKVFGGRGLPAQRPSWITTSSRSGRLGRPPTQSAIGPAPCAHQSRKSRLPGTAGSAHLHPHTHMSALPASSPATQHKEQSGHSSTGKGPIRAEFYREKSNQSSYPGKGPIRAEFDRERSNQSTVIQERTNQCTVIQEKEQFRHRVAQFPPNPRFLSPLENTSVWQLSH